MQLLVAPDICELLVVWYICVKVCWNNGWFIHKRITNASQHTILLYSEIPRNYCHYKIFNKTNYSMWKQSIDKFTVEIAVYFIPINLFYHLSNCRTHMKLVWFFFLAFKHPPFYAVSVMYYTRLKTLKYESIKCVSIALCCGIFWVGRISFIWFFLVFQVRISVKC